MTDLVWPEGQTGTVIRQLQSEINELFDARITAVEQTGGGGGGGGGGGAGGLPSTVQYNTAGALDGSSVFSYAAATKLLKTPLVGGLIHAAGAISGTWSPPLAQGAQVITATAAANITLAIPSGATLPSDHEVYLHLVITSTAAAPIAVTFDVGDTAGKYLVLHKQPLGVIFPSATVEYFVRWLGSRWALVGPQPARMTISFPVSGVPTASAVLFSLFVHNGGVAGGMWVPGRVDDVGNTTCGVAPSASTQFSIERSASGQAPWAQIGTLTFASGVKDWSTWSFPSGVTRFDHGDRLRIVAPANLNGLADLTWVMDCIA